jgi:magnesium chelatase family protein
MLTASILTRASAGLTAPPVTVEIHLSPGLPAFNVVGLPESSVREARERVRSALLTSYFEWPDHRITVNLAPADLPKGGGRFDLPIALGLLVATGQVPASALQGREIYGELALDGCIRSVPGLLAAVMAATEAGRECAVPSVGAPVLARTPDARLITGEDLLSLCGRLKQASPDYAAPGPIPDTPSAGADLAMLHGQASARRCLEIAAAGGHHLLMMGPPGAGKTLLARCLPGILPRSCDDEIYQRWLISDLVGQPLSNERPFRQPHHSASAVSLIGGGPRATPGEITLAHGGVLFLDELPEFPRSVLDTLRQPLESGEVMVSRARGSHRYPASFQLLAAMNPCPCGYLGDDDPPCRCSPDAVARYRARVSGPLLDRIDLHLALARQSAVSVLAPDAMEENSATVRARVAACRDRQVSRQGCSNAALAASQLLAVCQLTPSLQRWFAANCDRMQLSARGMHRCLRVARTLSDMADSETVKKDALLEALSYRPITDT